MGTSRSALGSPGRAARPEDAAPEYGRPGRWTRFGVWGNEAVLPLSVIHQPAIVAIAFTVVTWSAPALVRYVVIVVMSFAIWVALYQWLIRPFRVTRLLFGVGPKASPSVV